MKYKRAFPGCAFLMMGLSALVSGHSQDQLDGTELAWISEHQTIVFAGQLSYPPFEYMDRERGEYTGMTVELVRWMAAEFGFNAVFRPVPFAAAQEAVLSGQADILTGLFDSPERRLRFSFTEEVFSVPASIFCAADRTDIRELKDLRGKRLAVPRGDFAIEYLARRDVAVSFSYTDDFAEALRRVAIGDADAMIGDEQIVFHHIYSQRLTTLIKKAGEPLYRGKLCMAAKGLGSVPLSIVDKGLARARATGILSRVYEKWMGIRYLERASLMDRLALPILGAMAVLAAAAGAVVAWNLQLKRLVRAKTAELSDMNDTLSGMNDELKGANVQLLKDMDDRTAMEADRRALEARIVKAQKAESLALMAGSIAHDFNNLLTAIIGNVHLAKLRMGNEAAYAEYLDAAIATARRAGDLSRRMFDFAGMNRFVNEPVELNALLSDMRDMIKASAPGKIRVEIIPSSRAAIVMGDHAQIRQVVMNLILNAAEASLDGHGDVVVRCGTARVERSTIQRAQIGDDKPAGDWSFVEVLDFGEGIPAANLGRIFDPFFTTRKAGRGLGLAAVQGIMNGHGGAVIVESTPGMGSRFQALFPAAVPANAKEVADGGAKAVTSLSGSVLIVDDDPEVLATLGKTLESMGIDAVKAHDGKAALETVERGGSDLAGAIIDCVMPDMDGVETLERLALVSPDLPVILSTGYYDRSIHDRADKFRYKGFLVKPYGREELLAMLPGAFPALRRNP